jgi:exosortase K
VLNIQMNNTGRNVTVRERASRSIWGTLVHTRASAQSAKPIIQFAIVLTAAAALKQFYSMASANELLWILWPTARLTEIVTGTHFSFEPFAGYMSSDRSFLIAPACAGLNFLIATFFMLSLRWLWREHTTGLKWSSLIFIAIAAYSVTIAANTVRISSSLWFNRSHSDLAGLDRDEIHRLDGILVYFGSLLLLFVITENKLSKTRVSIRTYLFPLGAYYIMTLAVPIANGALWQGWTFWQHAGFVIATPVVLIAAAITIELFSRHAKRKNIATADALFPPDAAADEIGTRADIRDAAAFSHRTIGLKCGPVVADR